MSGLLGWDKLQHAAAYALLAFLLARFLGQWLPLRGRRVLVLTWIAVLLYGTLLEILQVSMKAGRAAEIQDIIADGVGALLVCVVLSHSKMMKYYRPAEAGSHRHG